MCTSVSWKNYFGRNLDLEYSYNETIAITPRHYPFKFSENHYAMIGIAYVQNNYPLYYDAMNEKGLGMAGLNFPGNAYYNDYCEDKINLAPFEFIPYILSQCSNVEEAKNILKKINLVNINFSSELSATPLHWMIADNKSSLVVESVRGRLNIFDNPVGVLTNNPTFDIQLFNLNNYMHLSTKEPKNTFLEGLITYSRGMGAIGLPGDLSSQSRFVKAVFTKMKAVSYGDDVNQFFHILSSVEQQRGCVQVGEEYEITLYSSCCDLVRGIYYYRTYTNSQICAVNMHNENLEGRDIKNYPLIKNENIFYQN